MYHKVRIVRSARLVRLSRRYVRSLDLARILYVGLAVGRLPEPERTRRATRLLRALDPRRR